MRYFVCAVDDPIIRKNMTRQQPAQSPLCVLIIMDGLGIRGDDYGNAVISSKTPVIDSLWTHCPHALLKASGNEVGLPGGYSGNSEVGHLNIGAGQIMYQSLAKINDSIRVGDFPKIPSLVKTFREVKKRKKKLHLMGILSAGGVHGHIEHLFELMRIAKEHDISPYIHVFLDGRDTGIKDGYIYLNMLNAKIHGLGVGKIASICGRWYAMDRNKRWERTEAAYNALIGRGERTAKFPMAILQDAYKQGEHDSIFVPTTIVEDDGNPVGPIGDDDVVIFFNYREDRTRQITKAFMKDPWEGFARSYLPRNIKFLAMSGYEENLPVDVLFEPQRIENTIASVVSSAGMTQLHIAETEKSAHISYFFNGGREDPYTGEDVFVIPSPKVKDYASTPAMSSEIIRDEVLYRLDLGLYNFVLVNLANPDMLGHTGNFVSTISAVEIMDKCIGDIINATIMRGGDFIITSDHGNCDLMINELTGSVDRAHTLNPVPLIIGKNLKQMPVVENMLKIGTGKNAIERGILSDVGTTALSLLGLNPTMDMTGIDLLPFIT